jgi:hypothetical protein
MLCELPSPLALVVGWGGMLPLVPAATAAGAGVDSIDSLELLALLTPVSDCLGDSSTAPWVPLAPAPAFPNLLRRVGSGVPGVDRVVARGDVTLTAGAPSSVVAASARAEECTEGSVPAIAVSSSHMRCSWALMWSHCSAACDTSHAGPCCSWLRWPYPGPCCHVRVSTPTQHNEARRCSYEA